jgi:diacylglycerol kinase family enzyme
VLGVANGLVHGSVPLGILPLGTANFLARTLLIPLKLEEAMDLIVGEHAIIDVDALGVGERCFFSNVSVGMSPNAVNDIRAAEVLISSTILLEKPPFLFGPPGTLSDGQFEVYVVTARTLVQADGEMIGHTPVEIHLLAKALHVIMPKPA